MRDVFSWRFFAAIGAVLGLLALVVAFADNGDDDVVDGASPPSTVVGRFDPASADPVAGPVDPFAIERRIDLVDSVFAISNDDLDFDALGRAAVDAELVLDGRRRLQVVTGTPGVDLCPERSGFGECAIVADLLGEGIVWFALVPMGPSETVELPAIDTLDDGIATLVNGWQLPFAPVLDRRCEDDEFESYVEFRDQLGDDFVSIYGLEERRLIAVRCRERVEYAPTTTIEGATTTTSTTATAP